LIKQFISNIKKWKLTPPHELLSEEYPSKVIISPMEYTGEIMPASELDYVEADKKCY